MERMDLLPINVELIKNESVKNIFENLVTIPLPIFEICKGEYYSFGRLATRDIYIHEAKMKQIEVVRSKIFNLEYNFYNGMFWVNLNNEDRQNNLIYNYFRTKWYERLIIKLTPKTVGYYFNGFWKTESIMWEKKIAIVSIDDLIKMNNNDDIMIRNLPFMIGLYSTLPLLELWNDILKLHWLYGALDALEKDELHKDNSAVDTKKLTGNHYTKNEVTIKKPYYKIKSFSQKTILLLFHKLKEYNFISSDITNTDLGKAIEGLTGFSSENIRQDLSEKESERELKYNVDDVVKLKESLIEIVKDLDKLEQKIKR